MDIDLEAEDNDVDDVPLGRLDVLYESQSSYYSASSLPESSPLHLEADGQACAIEERPQQRLQDLELDAHPPFWQRLINWLKLAAALFTQNTGVAVVTFPSAIASLTWAGGVSIALMAYLLSLYTLGLMLQLSNIKGQRAQSFRHLVYAVFGSKGRFFISFLTYLDCGGRVVVSFIVGGLASRSAYTVICSHTRSCQPYGLSAWILTVGAITLVISIVPNPFLRQYSAFLLLVPAGLTLGYTSLILWICAKSGHSQRTETGHRPPWNLENVSTLNVVFGAFSALGGIVRPFGGHALAYDCQAEGQGPPIQKAYGAAAFGYLLSGFCLFSVGFLGYWAFGELVSQSLLFGSTVQGDYNPGSITRPVWAKATADLLLLTSVLFEAQLCLQLSEVKEWMISTCLALLILFCILVATTFPFFGAFMALFGAIIGVPFAYVIIIALGGVVSLLATVGAARGLVYATLHNRFFT